MVIADRARLVQAGNIRGGGSNALPSGGQQLISSPYQYADQIVPDRGQPDGLTLVNSGQDAWQSNSAGGNAGIATATTAYIDYSWLQMQVSFLHL
ncbi:hypothetical protein PV328_001506 [Microctonus aethiopoides]|uniref:Uncharacterized protein n=1 Tax=Microctonus aethiopoides TaxID=144406 RepID=A0AA39FXS8_9HYME|nr:hypothetical protein PV328_001506 [Microctonus aethiopoides]